MSVAQLQQHSSGGDVGGPEEAPLVAPATLPFLVCTTKSHRAAWKKDCQVCQKKKEKKATCMLPTSNTSKQRHMSVARPQQHSSSSSSTAEVMSVAQLHTAAQQQQHSSGGDVSGPEEAPLVAPATLPFLVCSLTKSHGVAPHRGVSSAQRKVEGRHVCHIEKKKKKTATCRLPTSKASAVTNLQRNVSCDV